MLINLIERSFNRHFIHKNDVKFDQVMLTDIVPEFREQVHDDTTAVCLRCIMLHREGNSEEQIIARK